MKCPFCQLVHSHRTECQPIKELKTFCGDDEYQAKLKLKKERKRSK